MPLVSVPRANDAKEVSIPDERSGLGGLADRGLRQAFQLIAILCNKKGGPIPKGVIGPEFDRRIIQRTIGDTFE
jgi:hypothetical protein